MKDSNIWKELAKEYQYKIDAELLKKHPDYDMIQNWSVKRDNCNFQAALTGN